MHQNNIVNRRLHYACSPRNWYLITHLATVKPLWNVRLAVHGETLIGQIDDNNCSEDSPVCAFVDEQQVLIEAKMPASNYAR
jgi:hypothetical protein